MMARILKGLLLLGICFSTQAADVTQTFNDAKTWGAQQQTSIPGQINPGTAQTKVPNYQSTSPATNNYGNGNASLFGLGSAKVSDCSTNPTDPQYSSQECNAVNTVAKSPSQRPQFNLSKSDPVFQASSSVINDPSQVAGSVSGTYSGCTTKTTTIPATNDTETCYIYHPVNQQTCAKILTVTVNQGGYKGCSPGQLLFTVPIPWFGKTYYEYFYCPSAPGSLSVNDMGCGYSLPEDGADHYMTCNGFYTYGHINCDSAHDACTYYQYSNGQYSANYKYTPLQNNITTTDTWSDQCTSLEAAAQ